MDRRATATHTVAAASHTAGQGTTHDSAYGTSTSHNEGGGTTHTNAYGGKTSGEYGEGATHTNTYGGTRQLNTEGATHTNAYGGAYGRRCLSHRRLWLRHRVSSADRLLWLSSARHGQLLRINMRELQRLGSCRSCYNRRCYRCGCRFSKCKRCQCQCCGRVSQCLQRWIQRRRKYSHHESTRHDHDNRGCDTRQLFHGTDGCSAPGRLHYTHRPRHDLLLMR